MSVNKVPHIVNKLRALQTTMHDIAADLEYIAGFNPDWRYHAKQLHGAGNIAAQWADELDAQATTINIDTDQEKPCQLTK